MNDKKPLSVEMWDWNIMDGHIRPDEWKVQEWSRNAKALEDRIVELGSDLVRIRGYLDTERVAARESITMLRNENKTLKARIAELEALLIEYKDAECRALKSEGEAKKRIAELNSSLNERQGYLTAIHTAVFGKPKNPKAKPRGMAVIRKFKELLDRIAELEAQNRWIPVSERLPEEDGRYLVKIVNHYQPDLGWWIECENWSRESGTWSRIYHSTVTDWKPITPPEAE